MRQVIQENFAAAFDGDETSPRKWSRRRAWRMIELLKHAAQARVPEPYRRDRDVRAADAPRTSGGSWTFSSSVVRRLLAGKRHPRSTTPTKATRVDRLGTGYDPLYGARPVKRTIQRYVVNDLSKRILGGRRQPRAADPSSTPTPMALPSKTKGEALLSGRDTRIRENPRCFYSGDFFMGQVGLRTEILRRLSSAPVCRGRSRFRACRAPT